MYSSAVSSGSESSDLPVANFSPNKQPTGSVTVSRAASNEPFGDVLQLQVSSYTAETADNEPEIAVQAGEQQLSVDTQIDESVERLLVENGVDNVLQQPQSLHAPPVSLNLAVQEKYSGSISSNTVSANGSVFSTLRGEVDGAPLQQPQSSLQPPPVSLNFAAQDEYSGPTLPNTIGGVEGGLAQNSQFNGSGEGGGFQQLLSRLSKELNEEAVQAEIEDEDGYRSIADQAVSRRSSEVSSLLGSSVAGRPVLNADEWLKVVNRQLQFMFKNGASSVNFKLTPENLGKLDIQIVQEKGITQVWFGTTDPQVKELIESTFSRLRLALDGEVEGELNLFTRDGEDSSEQQENQSTFTQSFGDGTDAELESTELRLDLSSFHRIDTFI